MQLGKHLINHNAQNDANSISDSSDSLQYLISQQFFDEATCKDLTKIQEIISEKRNANDNLINVQANQQSDEIFLINESLHKPLLNFANKLLGRRHLNFERSHLLSKICGTNLRKVTFTNFSLVKKTLCPNSGAIGLHFQPHQK